MIKNKGFVIAMVIFIAIALIVVIIVAFLSSEKGEATPLPDSGQEVLVLPPNGEEEEGDAFVIDESQYLEEESAKMKVTEEQRVRIETDIVSLLEQREWEKARVVLDELFESHNAFGKDGAILRDYQSDIGIINLLPQTDKELYTHALKGIRSPKVMLAASVYLATPVKLGVFIDGEGIVPTPENPTLRFGDFTETVEHPILARLDAIYPGEYLSIIEAPFALEGIEYTAYLVMTIDGYARPYRIETTDPESYYMTVLRWNQLLYD